MKSRPLTVMMAGFIWPLETFVVRLIGGLAEAGVRVIVPYTQPPERAWRSVENIEWMSAPSWSGPQLDRLGQAVLATTQAGLRSWSETRMMFKEARLQGTAISQLERMHRLAPFAGRDWDVVYFPWNTGAVLYGPLMSLGPAVISCRGGQININPHEPGREEYRAALRESFERAAAVHCVSEAILDEAVELGMARKKATVIRPAVDPEFFRPPETPRTLAAAPYRIITTGAVIWRKGFEYALEAIRVLADRQIPVQFHIIGDGDEWQRLLYTIHDLRLSDHVVLHGRLSPPEVLAQLQQADVFLLSSLSEGIANAVLEAMATELPVVTTKVGGMAEAVADGIEGLVVPARCPEAMASALQKLWEQPELRPRMGGCGRERILREFTLEEQVARFVELFESVA